MGEIRMVRIDFRLIHGQVIVKWFAQSGADTIAIIDDNLSSDEFMKDIYKLASYNKTNTIHLKVCLGCIWVQI